MTAAIEAAAPRPLAPALARAAMIGSAACWGGATVLSKAALEVAPPFTLVALQLAASVLALRLATALSDAGPRLSAPDRRAAAATGLLEPGAAYAVGTLGLALTSAASSAVISATEPFLVTALGLALFGLRPSRRELAALGLATLGMALAIGGPALAVAPEAGRGMLGDGLVLLGVLFAALYVVSSHRLASRGSALRLAITQQSAGLALALALAAAAIGAGFEAPARPSAAGLALVLVSGVVQYAIAFWLYLTALRGLALGEAALYLTLTPLFGVAGGALVLGEAVGAATLLGAALVIAALRLAATRG